MVRTHIIRAHAPVCIRRRKTSRLLCPMMVGLRPYTILQVRSTLCNLLILHFSTPQSPNRAAAARLILLPACTGLAMTKSLRIGSPASKVHEVENIGANLAWPAASTAGSRRSSRAYRQSAPGGRSTVQIETVSPRAVSSRNLQRRPTSVDGGLNPRKSGALNAAADDFGGCPGSADLTAGCRLDAG
jgi:hypothetical protein